MHLFTKWGGEGARFESALLVGSFTSLSFLAAETSLISSAVEAREGGVSHVLRLHFELRGSKFNLVSLNWQINICNVMEKEERDMDLIYGRPLRRRREAAEKY